MKVVKSYLTVDDVINNLTDEDKEQVKCAYFSDVQYNSTEIHFVMVVDEEDGDLEDHDISEVWQDPVDVKEDLDYDDRIRDEGYYEYLKNNYNPETDNVENVVRNEDIDSADTADSNKDDGYEYCGSLIDE